MRHLNACGAVQLREGAEHTVYLNPDNGRRSTVPRHREIKATVVKAICRQLEVPEPANPA